MSERRPDGLPDYPVDPAGEQSESAAEATPDRATPTRAWISDEDTLNSEYACLVELWPGRHTRVGTLQDVAQWALGFKVDEYYVWRSATRQYEQVDASQLRVLAGI